MLLRASLLYEYASLPALSAVLMRQSGQPGILPDFFRRQGIFKNLGYRNVSNGYAVSGDLAPMSQLPLMHDALAIGKYEQGFDRDESDAIEYSESDIASEYAKWISFDFNATDYSAFGQVFRQRVKLATRANVEGPLFDTLQSLEFPAELLPAQRQAIVGGLLNNNIDSWGFAAPTGSGKSFLTRLLITDLLTRDSTAKTIYVVPSRALVHEVSTTLAACLDPLGWTVAAVSAQLVGMDEDEALRYDDASVVVLTPEKADMLLRINPEFFLSVKLIIVDEAHHIESGTRGALLELYLWRLKRLLPNIARYVLLSAVAPNISQIADWLGDRPSSVVVTQRPTRMRAGVYRKVGTGRNSKGIVAYSDNTEITLVDLNVESQVRKGIAQLASHLSIAGPVLVVAKGKGECESLAAATQKWLESKNRLTKLSDQEVGNDEYRRLDRCLEREMYSTVPMRALIKNRIAYHHAGLPPHVRHYVEDAIRAGLIQFVFATTTLAEGVNFPFSSVIVQSLALRNPPEVGRPSSYSVITPRTFWNIAGRAGRPGFDKEGQIILYEQSLGLDKVQAVLQDYLEPSLNRMRKVRSALANAISDIHNDIAENRYTAADLSNAQLPANIGRAARGAINLLRVGVVHARATNVISRYEEILDGTFAKEFLEVDEVGFAKDLLESQGRLLESYLESPDAPSVEVVSKLGLSIETLSDLRDYVHRLEDWQIQRMDKLFYGGDLNLRQAPYVVGPVAKRMAELEGPTLGGFYSDIIVQWLSGVPFLTIKAESNFSQRLEDLISVVYSRIQFLLPWALYAVDALVDAEATRRGINYNNEIVRLAYLADAGVPSLDALRLTKLDFERVDASRLAKAFSVAGGLRQGVDIVGWLISLDDSNLQRIIAGLDNRRAAIGFFEQVRSLRPLTR